MSNYSRNYDFSVKDGLTTGNPAKLIKGSEVDDEFDDVATAIATKRDSSDAVLASTLTTRGDIATQGASAAQRLALGTAGQVAGSDGTDVVYLNGLWEDVSDTTLSADSEVEWTINDGYIYHVIVSNLVNSATSRLNWYENASGYQTTDAYFWVWNLIGSASAGGDAANDWGGWGLNNNVTTDHSGIFFNAGSSTYPTTFYGQSIGLSSSALSHSRRVAATAASQLKIELSAGATMTSGRVLIRRQKELN